MVQVFCQFRGLVLNFLELIGIKQIYDMKLMHSHGFEVLRFMSREISISDKTEGYDDDVDAAIFRAAECGIVEFIIEMIKANHAFSTLVNKETKTIFDVAVEKHQEKILSLLYGLDWEKNLGFFGLDKFKNNMLHMAGMLSPSSQLDRISGAALQMQRELQWYKELESMMHPIMRERVNEDNKTPWQVFTEQHKNLVKAGEKWMKGTATSCTVVGALIITIMFAAAFTVPGGNQQDSGYPISSHKKRFLVFVISDAISLFSSTTSVLMFLGILTSRYAMDDFLKSLPTKLIIGLSTLFFSIAAMMVTFCAALFLMLEGELRLIIPIILLASVPVTLFVLLHFPLLVEIFMSTYGPSIFDRKLKWL